MSTKWKDGCLHARARVCVCAHTRNAWKQLRFHQRILQSWITNCIAEIRFVTCVTSVLVVVVVCGGGGGRGEEGHVCVCPVSHLPGFLPVCLPAFLPGNHCFSNMLLHALHVQARCDINDYTSNEYVAGVCVYVTV